MSGNSRLVVFDSAMANDSSRYDPGLRRAEAVACLNCDPAQRDILQAAGFTAQSTWEGPVDVESELDQVPVTVMLWTRD